MTAPTRAWDDGVPVRDGHSLNLHLEHMSVDLSINCPYDGADWRDVPVHKRPPCRGLFSGLPVTECILQTSAKDCGVIEMIGYDKHAHFTATVLPVEVEWGWDDDGYAYVTPIVQPPGEDEYREQVAAVARRAAERAA